MDLPKLGPDFESNLGSSPLVEYFSPSIFLNSPVPVGSLADFLPYSSDGLLDRTRGRDLDVLPCFGGSSSQQEGSGHLEGFAQVGSLGWAGLPPTGYGGGGSLPVDEWRTSLGLAEHRWFGSPGGVFLLLIVVFWRIQLDGKLVLMAHQNVDAETGLKRKNLGIML